MGNFPNQADTNIKKNQNQNFLQTVDKVSKGSLELFGNFDLYQQTQKPYDYFIQYIQAIGPRSQATNQKLNFYRNLPKNKNIPPVSYVEVIQRKQRCAQFQALRIFCPYFNFTLQDAIRLKIKQKNSFTQPQIVYILKSLLSIGKFYQNQLKTNFYSGIFKTKNIFISPEGHIKVYPFNENIFVAYMEKNMQNQSTYEVLNFESNEKSKPICSTRDQSGIYKSTLNKSREGIRKSKLTTTLKNQKFDPKRSQQILQLKGVEVNKMSRRTSNAILSNQQSSQSFNFLYKTFNENQNQIKRDFFELGLLLMQLILLNEQRQYYKNKNSSLSSIEVNKSCNFNNTNYFAKSSSHGIPFGEMEMLSTFKRLEEYENQNGKIPNVDLISFSLNNLLPKKSISSTLIDLIKKMILASDQDQLSYEDFFDTIERQQELSQQSRYCIKFENSKQNNSSDKHMASYIVRDKVTDPMSKTSGFNTVKLNFDRSGVRQREQSANLTFKQKLQKSKNFNSNLKESQHFSSSKKLQDFLGYSNLSKSFMMDEDCLDSTKILNNLKKSRKLIPSKIRSISTKLQHTAVL